MKSNMTLLPGEHVVMASDGDILLLTNQRVRYDSVEFGASRYMSMTLDAVASCGLVTRSYPILLLLGVIGLVMGATVPMRDEPTVFVWLFGAVFSVGYFLTRTAVIAIASSGGEVIQVPTKGMSREDSVAFLEAVEKEKLSSQGRLQS